MKEEQIVELQKISWCLTPFPSLPKVYFFGQKALSCLPLVFPFLDFEEWKAVGRQEKHFSLLDLNFLDLNFLGPKIFGPKIFGPKIFGPKFFGPEFFQPKFFRPKFFRPKFFGPDFFEPNFFGPEFF